MTLNEFEQLNQSEQMFVLQDILDTVKETPLQLPTCNDYKGQGEVDSDPDGPLPLPVMEFKAPNEPKPLRPSPRMARQPDRPICNDDEEALALPGWPLTSPWFEH